MNTARRIMWSIALVIVAATGCMRATPYVSAVLTRAPVADSATVALWSMDEPSGDWVSDSGPYRLAGIAGIDARTDFGRFEGARLFTHSAESFIFVDYAPVLETGDALSIEVWLYLNDFSLHEVGMVAGRWTEKANEQSWMLGVVGKQPLAITPLGSSPGLLRHLVSTAETGHVMFAFQPLEASAPLPFFSSEPLVRGRWTHVAVTFNGEVVRFYLDGRVDSQYATHNQIRPSPAPLLIGNYFDPGTLTAFGGRLRLEPGLDATPFYTINGWIDELRISNVERYGFIGAPPGEE